jgi:hypothetical protein
MESSHCNPKFDGYLSEVRRVIRPGGHLNYADFRSSEKIEGWRDSFVKSGLTLLRETDITPNVVSAHDIDNDRKLRLIPRLVPRPLQASFLDFAAVRGTKLYEGFKSGAFTYRSFVLQKALRRLS